MLETVVLGVAFGGAVAAADRHAVFAKDSSQLGHSKGDRHKVLGHHEVEPCTGRRCDEYNNVRLDKYLGRCGHGRARARDSHLIHRHLEGRHPPRLLQKHPLLGRPRGIRDPVGRVGQQFVAHVKRAKERPVVKTLAAAPCARVDDHNPWSVSQGFDQPVLWREADNIVGVENGSDCCGRREGAVEGDSSRGIGGGSSAHSVFSSLLQQERESCRRTDTTHERWSRRAEV